jgi:hypothetical protein
MQVQMCKSCYFKRQYALALTPEENFHTSGSSKKQPAVNLPAYTRLLPLNPVPD